MQLALALSCLSAILGCADAVDNSLLWGPYRPNVYFGMRPRIPNSLISGLMWFQTKNIGGITAIRHDCGNDDNVAKFGWTGYDPRTGGRQVVYDKEHNVNITTELVKSEDGLSWEVKIKGEQAPDSILTSVWYSGLESADANTKESLSLSSKTKKKLTPKGIDGDISLHGYSEELGGRFVISVSKGTGDYPSHPHEYSKVKPAENSHYFSLQVPAGQIWRAKDVFLTLCQDEVGKYLAKYGEEETDIPTWSVFSLSDSDSLGGNTHFVQKTFKGPFEYTISFVPEASSGFPKTTTFEERLDKILRDQEEKLNKSLSIKEPYTSEEHYAFAKEMISSIAGGIGYFYGDSLVKSSDEESGPDHSKPRELFSGTPSRAFFPRGFYWDEGFHALALMNSDTDLVLQIVNSWFQTMDDDGWIEREQILGDEGRSRVPEEFQVQDPHVANPPTLVMALAHLGSITNDKPLLRKFYPALKKHFDWFRREQKGELTTLDREYPSREAYRWRGHANGLILASGIDDYPRTPEPNDGELHVDLLAWVGAMALSLSRVANLLGEDQDKKYFESVIAGVTTNLEETFWNNENEAYCDITTDEWEEDSHECHIGYVSHLPFFLKLVPETSEDHLLAVLDDLRDPEQLWSVGGIRSLSKKDEFFGTGENYWRGPVWNNMNFLALDALQYYGGADSKASSNVKAKAAEIYHELRRLIVDNIYNQWVESGYVWESYEATTGEPKGARGFTGWAGLVANIMAMPDQLVLEPELEEPQQIVDPMAANPEEIIHEDL